jgi:hypothetical protein
MSIKTGRYGLVKWDSVPASPVSPAAIASLNGWKLSVKPDYEDVTCFQDTNKVYVPGLRDVSGSLSGFWNSSDRALFAASQAETPGYLELYPNNTSAEVEYLFAGLAYLDADIDATAKGAPKITGNIRAAGPWIIPS